MHAHVPLTKFSLTEVNQCYDRRTRTVSFSVDKHRRVTDYIFSTLGTLPAVEQRGEIEKLLMNLGFDPTDKDALKTHIKIDHVMIDFNMDNVSQLMQTVRKTLVMEHEYYVGGALGLSMQEYGISRWIPNKDYAHVRPTRVLRISFLKKNYARHEVFDPKTIRTGMLYQSTLNYWAETIRELSDSVVADTSYFAVPLIIYEDIIPDLQRELYKFNHADSILRDGPHINMSAIEYKVYPHNSLHFVTIKLEKNYDY